MKVKSEVSLFTPPAAGHYLQMMQQPIAAATAATDEDHTSESYSSYSSVSINSTSLALIASEDNYLVGLLHELNKN